MGDIALRVGRWLFVTVVMSVPSQTGTHRNPTVNMLLQSLPDDIEEVGFSWREAFRMEYDVLHVHWPERLIRDGGSRKPWQNSLAFMALMLMLRLRRRTSIWTVHNSSPHEPGDRWEALALRAWDRLCSHRVFMYQAARLAPYRQSDVVIPRGDYSPMLESNQIDLTLQPIPGRLLQFGFLRPYKGLDVLIPVVGGMNDDQVTLRIVGSPMYPEFAQELMGAAEQFPHVSIDARKYLDRELAEEVLRAELVVLAYRRAYNSGAALFALTFRRPVLLPDSPTMRELRDEVGEDWVHLYQGEITAEVIRAAQVRARAALESDSEPDLSRREWCEVGLRYAELYRGSNPVRA